MIKIFFSFIFLLEMSLSLLAQRSEVLTFQDRVFDFGRVPEAGGAVVHIFEFQNTGDRPIKILSVKPSCGCTTPDWTRGVIKAGDKGSITAKFDPKGRPGFFNKTLTIATDFSNEAIVLTIKGTVSLQDDHSAFREAKGAWRLTSTSFNMGKVLLKDEYTWKEFDVVNGGSATIALTESVIAPAHIKVEISPASLKSGDKGIIRIGYNAKLKNAYGFQTDNVEFITNDESMQRKSFSVYATLEEFFPTMNHEELTKVPRLYIAESTLDLGRFASTASIEKQLTLTNTGKKELSIRSIQANCQCLQATSEKAILAAGKSMNLTLRFNPEQRKGTQQKFVTLYTNDPINPVQRITIMAYIEN